MAEADELALAMFDADYQYFQEELDDLVVLEMIKEGQSVYQRQ